VSVPVFVRQQAHFGATADLQSPMFPVKQTCLLPVRSTHNAEVEGSSPSLSTKNNNLRSHFSAAFQCAGFRPSYMGCRLPSEMHPGFHCESRGPAGGVSPLR
jgi:hypothetical protein